MPGLQIKILLSLGAAAVLFAFVCEIRLSGNARRLARRLGKARPDLWSGLNPVARNWNGGHPGLKLVFRRHAAELRPFEQHYLRLQSLERQLLWGIAVAAACLGIVLAGTVFWGWDW